MAQNLTLTLVASGLILTACGGGGDGGAADSAAPGTGVTTPVPVPALGDPSGFPVGAAFANVRKQGFFESTTLKQQASPYLDVFQEVSRSGRLTPQTVDAFGTYGATSTASQFLGTYPGHNY